MLHEFTGKSVLITGGTAGIGMATAKAFAMRGARVTINGRSAERLDQALTEVGALGNVTGVVADVADAKQCTTLYETVAQNGPLDILVNNVGTFGVCPFYEITDEEWLRFFNVNVMSAVRLCRLALPPMLHRHTGRIVNVSSEAGVKPRPETIHYSVTKTALVGLSRGLAEMTKGTGVTVNSVLAGPTWTEGVRRYFEGLAHQEGRSVEDVTHEYFRKHEHTSLLQRFLDPAEVADAIVFLAGNPGVNGTAQRIEGGMVQSIL